MFIENLFGEAEQLALMSQAVESAQNGIIITDPSREDNPIIYTNPAFSRITGYGASEILGKNCRFLQGTDRAQPGLSELRKAVLEERSITISLRNYRKTGEQFFNELTVSPVHNEQGRLVAFIGIQNDITGRVEAEQRVSDFYSIVSHELRTPIAKIKSSLAVIADGEAGPINETVRRFVEISAKSAESLWKLIENILDFKKLESGKFRLVLRRLGLGELVEDVVSEFQPVAHDAAIRITCVCSLNPHVNADGPRVVQVIENLLSNAIKFSPAGSEVVVRVLVENPNFARIEVCDNGPGIAKVDLPKLFEKFQQLNSPDRRLRGGTGLGLTVCKAIVDAHAGRLGVITEEGKGSTFWVELPKIND